MNIGTIASPHPSVQLDRVIRALCAYAIVDRHVLFELAPSTYIRRALHVDGPD
ncbi:MAG: hypothetical protein ABI045_01655 [Flavobacteriales bacterium]